MTDTSDDERPTMGSLGYTEQFTWGSEDDPDPPVAKRHWGKYRGTVIDNQDVPPSGRLLVSVPGIVITNWAMPCVPFAGVFDGDVHTAAASVPTSGSSSSAAIPTSRSGSAAGGARARSR